ncbi:MAG: tyrosine--tRNA ligase, partial [Acidobacteriia bacterium]|nr:tyrosine--tRNA ligase [Terriglobia bacterium]
MTQELHNPYLAELLWRGFLDNITSDELGAHLSEAQRTIYVGFDPTADSLHLGSLVPVMALAHAQRFGHRPLAIVGGGTGLIGDPSGKTSERSLLSRKEAARNTAAIGAQLSKFFDLSEPEKGLLVNNADWLVPLRLIEFLREIGKHFSVNEMIKRDSVRMRLEEREHGISYTEFTYMLLQAYDFLHVAGHFHCTIQLGGSDQWGNIVMGIELLRKLREVRGYAMVSPLVTTTAGVKFGKTEAGSVWLDPQLTSPYRFYQFWINTDDRDVVKYLKFFTLLDRAEIAELENALEVAPEKREAQKRLAQEVTRVVHGDYELRKAIQASQVLFGGEIADLSAQDVLDIF